MCASLCLFHFYLNCASLSAKLWNRIGDHDRRGKKRDIHKIRETQVRGKTTNRQALMWIKKLLLFNDRIFPNTSPSHIPDLTQNFTPPLLLEMFIFFLLIEVKLKIETAATTPNS